jgi:MFS family permease
MRNKGLIDPLRRRPFRRLVTSYAVNELGDWMAIIALSVLIFERTDSALATAALFLGTSFLPALAAPILVTRGERPPPRLVLPVIYCVEAAAFGALALLAGHFSLPAVIVVATFDRALALTGRSLTRAVVAVLLKPAGELRAGNALFNFALTAGSTLGPGLAGLIVGAFGVQTALLLDAGSFCVIALLLLTAGPLPQAEPEPGKMRERVRAGVVYLRERKTLRRLLLAQGAAFIFFAAVIPIEVFYAKQTLGTTDSGYGVLLTSWGVGMVVGSIVFAAVRRAPLPYLLFFSTIAVGAGYLGLAAAPTLAVACGVSVVGGAGNGVQWVSVVSAVQELTTETMQARVTSVLESIGAAMPGIGIALGGVIATVASPRAAFFVAGAGILAIVAVVTPILGSNWPERPTASGSNDLDGGDDVVLELIPGSRPVPSHPEVLR